LVATVSLYHDIVFAVESNSYTNKTKVCDAETGHPSPHRTNCDFDRDWEVCTHMSKRICPLAHSTLFMILNTLALVLDRGHIIVSTFNRVVSLVHSRLCRRWDANARKTGENNCTSIR
jgi:hypothetical protein